MKDKVFTVRDALKKQNFKRIIETVKSGGIIVFPTDTLYGIGASIKHKKSIERIYRIKKRPRKKPIAILLSSWRQASHIVGRVHQRIRMLMKEYWPGAVTLIVASGTKKVGLRVPNHKFALKLISETGPLATTSANTSGKSPPYKKNQIEKRIIEEADIVIVDEKPLKGFPSTVLDVSSGEVEIIREGSM
ncbi:MAG: threonylcarbamoyl-AMP synthase [Elusimicrobia bacterium]|nr:threonylcarbamoyl-AMP synthase [Elusimicrobiota bacterium]